MMINHNIVLTVIAGFLHGCIGLPLIFMLIRPLVKAQMKFWDRILPVTKGIYTVVTFFFLSVLWVSIGWLWLNILQARERNLGNFFVLAIPIGLVFFVLIPAIETSIQKKRKKKNQ